MKKVTSLALVTAFFSLPTFAEVNVYGKANLSLQQTDEGDSLTELVSNTSRIGLKGKEKLENSGLEVFYKFEYETAVDSGDTGGGETFSQRNIYLGVKGNFGAVQAGRFDTPLKTAQKKIDLFNDLEGDIKSIITSNDNRESNAVSYTTPSTMGGFKANVALIASEDSEVSDATSFSLAYESNGFYGAVAMDSDVEAEGTDVTRAVIQYNVNALQLGALYETQDEGDLDSVSGWVVSAQYKIEKVALKLQVGQSDIITEGGDTLSIGADYKVSKTFKTFAFFTTEEADDDRDNQYVGIGAELKF